MFKSKEEVKCRNLTGCFQGYDNHKNLFYAMVELKTTEPKLFEEEDISLGMEVNGSIWKPVLSLKEGLLTEERVWRVGNVYEGITLVKISSSCVLSPSNLRILITDWFLGKGHPYSYKVTSFADPFWFGFHTDLQKMKRFVICKKLENGKVKGANLDKDGLDGDGFPVGMWCDYNSDYGSKLTHDDLCFIFNSFPDNDLRFLSETMSRLALRLYSHDDE
jgi:hypothetical protein